MRFEGEEAKGKGEVGEKVETREVKRVRSVRDADRGSCRFMTQTEGQVGS